jgi:hypothetical protein
MWIGAWRLGTFAGWLIWLDDEFLAFMEAGELSNLYFMPPFLGEVLLKCKQCSYMLCFAVWEPSW